MAVVTVNLIRLCNIFIAAAEKFKLVLFIFNYIYVQLRLLRVILRET